MLYDELTSLSAASVDETLGTEMPMHGYDRAGWSVVTSAGVSSGVVEIEWAQTSGYSGTWANIDSITLAAASTQYGSSQDIIGGFVRARISTVVGGGTVTVVLKRAKVGVY